MNTNINQSAIDELHQSAREHKSNFEKLSKLLLGRRSKGSWENVVQIGDEISQQATRVAAILLKGTPQHGELGELGEPGSDEEFIEYIEDILTIDSLNEKYGKPNNGDGEEVEMVDLVSSDSNEDSDELDKERKMLADLHKRLNFTLEDSEHGQRIRDMGACLKNYYDMLENLLMEFYLCSNGTGVILFSFMHESTETVVKNSMELLDKALASVSFGPGPAKEDDAVKILELNRGVSEACLALKDTPTADSMAFQQAMSALAKSIDQTRFKMVAQVGDLADRKVMHIMQEYELLITLLDRLIGGVAKFFASHTPSVHVMDETLTQFKNLVEQVESCCENVFQPHTASDTVGKMMPATIKELEEKVKICTGAVDGAIPQELEEYFKGLKTQVDLVDEVIKYL